ncbi:B-family DNA polymerase [Heterosigma akashiwo virus 01]|uniref:DNA-directed DNA polymerase n=1 Tax=Heterosigma akashiwo virus 01 TaxID=97195 RepID=A0A1C9C5F1_HAV01|nr:B-family DNA polymerase [Heterosigma akashiwo virus 01]AOM63508.1 B-family DNA polymerase [Heterosigma akashiwo virus 01]
MEIIECQVFSFYPTDFLNNRNFTVFAFGRKEDGSSVGIEIVDFKPFMYLHVPERQQKFWTMNNTEDLRKTLVTEHEIKELRNINTVMKKRLFPYTNKDRELFLMLEFNTEWGIRKCSMSLRENYIYKNFDVYESNISPMLRLMHMREILPSGWVRIKNYDQNNTTKCDTNIRINFMDIIGFERDDIAPCKISSFDIECMSFDAYTQNQSIFPSYERENDTISQIGMATWSYGNNEEVLKRLYTLGNAAEPTDQTIDIIQCDNEGELIIRWFHYIAEIDPDIITGYNIFGFDWEYIKGRVDFLGIEDEILSVASRIDKLKSRFMTKELNSSAFGDNEFKFLEMPGRIEFDFFSYIKREHKLESYKLDNVAYHFTKQKKHDVKPMDIFIKLMGTPEDVREVAEYCVQDTFLIIELMKKLCVIPNLIEMSKVTRVPFEYLILRGQQIKVFSQIFYEAMKENIVIPTNILKLQGKKDRNEEHEKYTGATVLTANSGCYFDCVSGLDFASLYPSIMIAYNMCYTTLVLNERELPREAKIETIEWENNRHRFVQNKEGLLPKILKKLWITRKSTKRLMNETENKEMKTILNGKQLAIKVSMNSVYGFCGVMCGILPCVAIASSVTTKGRQMIEHTQNMVKQLYPDAKVIYGDSVTKETPLMLRTMETCGNHKHEVISIENVFTDNMRSIDMYSIIGEKEHVMLSRNEEIWTGENWSRIIRVIRHKTQKKIYGVLTENGYVEVTEDHSLISSDYELLKPKNCIVKETQLLQSFPDIVENSTIENNMIDIPKGQPCRLTVFGQVSAMIIYTYLKRKNYSITLNVCNVNSNKFYISFMERPRFKNTKKNIIKKIFFIRNTDNEEYVYDVETEDGIFHAGIGEIIVKNTDSVYVNFPSTNNDMQKVFDISIEAAEAISKTFPQPIELEFEKVMYPFILFTKKRYASLIWTRVDKPDKIDFKGIQVVRRDNCSYVRESLTTIYNCLLYERNVDKCLGITDKIIDDLLKGRVPIEKLTVSKSLKSNYKSKTMPHFLLAEKMKQRDPMNYPRPGERVPYVFIENTEARLQGEKAENPEYAKENGLIIDTLYYLDHQMKKPLAELFNIVLGEGKYNLYKNHMGFIKMKKNHQERERLREINRKKGQKELNLKWFSKKK